MFIYNNLDFYIIISVSILVLLLVFVIYSSGRLSSNNSPVEEEKTNLRELREKYMLKGFKESADYEKLTEEMEAGILPRVSETNITELDEARPHNKRIKKKKNTTKNDKITQDDIEPNILEIDDQKEDMFF